MKMLGVKNQQWPLQLALPTLCVRREAYTHDYTFKAFQAQAFPLDGLPFPWLD